MKIPQRSCTRHVPQCRVLATKGPLATMGPAPYSYLPLRCAPSYFMSCACVKFVYACASNSVPLGGALLISHRHMHGANSIILTANGGDKHLYTEISFCPQKVVGTLILFSLPRLHYVDDELGIQWTCYILPT